jgi:hypothetical protein
MTSTKWTLLAVLVVSIALCETVAAQAHRGMSGATRSALAAKATELASSLGDPHPSSLEVVYTNERRYLRVENAGGGGRSWITPKTPVYFVVMRGHFVCPRCRRPVTVLSTAYVADGLKPANPVAFRTRYPSLKLAGRPIRIGLTR